MFVKTNGATSSNYIFILGMAIIGQLMVTVNGQMTSGNEASVQTGETRCVGIQPNLSEWMQQMETLLRSVQDGIKTLNEHQFTLDQQADDRFDGCPSYRKRGGTGVSCPSLRSFTNANLSTTHVAYGTKVNVSCSSRQQLMTSSSNWIITECQADGTWSVKPSNCMSTGYCSWPDVVNVVITHVFGGFVNISCRPGFEYENDPQWIISQCIDNTNWIPVPKSCNRVSCPSLRSFTNANLNTTQVSYGTKVYVSCTSGQQLMTSSSNWIITECQADRTWSVVPSNCLNSMTPVNINSVPNGNPVMAIVMHNNELYVGYRNDKFVSVYDASTVQLKRRLKFPGLKWTAGLAVDSANNYLYISDNFNGRVNRVDLSNNIIKRWNVAADPYGLSVNSNRNVLVACFLSMKVQEFTPDGQLVREISHSNRVFHALELNDGTLLVSVSGPPHHGIQRIAKDGRIVQSFGEKTGSALQQHVIEPRTMAVDSMGNVIIAVVHNVPSIRIVNSALKFALSIPINVGLRHPVGMYYDESRGRLYVGEHEERNRLLAFSNVFNFDAMFDN